MGIGRFLSSTLGANKPAATGAAAATAASGPSPGPNGASGPDLSQLRAANPRIDELIQQNPGLGKLLAKNTVSPGPREGETRTEITWQFWTHSEKTNKKYGHGMSDKQITSDYIVVFQPSPEKDAKVSLGRNQYPGHEIVGVYQTGQHIPRMGTAYDGGHLGEFDVVTHGKKGEKAVLAWAIVTVGEDGNVRGGGYPTSRGGQVVPYQDQKSGTTSAGGEYWGRAARITHGDKNNFVPITDN